MFLSFSFEGSKIINLTGFTARFRKLGKDSCIFTEDQKIPGMKLKIIITGATGMVGEDAPAACPEHPDVEQVLAVSRKLCGTDHPQHGYGRPVLEVTDILNLSKEI